MRDSPRSDLQELEISEAIQEQAKAPPTTSDPQLELTIATVALRSEWADAIASACLSEKDFTSLPARTIWKAKTVLRDRGVDRNPVTLLSEITATSSLRAIGGDEGIQSFYTELGDEKEIGSYCEQLRNFTIARAQASAGRSLQTLARKPMDATARIEKTQEILSEILTSGSGRSTMETAQNVVDRVGLDKLMNPTPENGYITTGWGPLDQLIIGFEPGTINVLGAVPGGGKTAWACSLAMHVAGVLHKPVAIFSLEMYAKGLLRRMACNIGRINYGQYRRGEMTDEERDRFTAALYTLQEMPLRINERKGFTVPEMEHELYAMIAQGLKPELVIVDHLQKMKHVGHSKDLREAFTQIFDSMTNLFKRLEIAGLVLSQLTKEGKKADRPKLADTREAGNIQDNADWGGILNRPHINKQGATPEEKRLVELFVDKQREGEQGKVEFEYYGEHFLFKAIDRLNSW